jgi:hypothetical protein
MRSKGGNVSDVTSISILAPGSKQAINFSQKHDFANYLLPKPLFPMPLSFLEWQR